MIAATISLDNEAWRKFLETDEHQVPKAVEAEDPREGSRQVSKQQMKAIMRGATKWTSGTTHDTNRGSSK
jgi:hypothetical protein